jgi:hypothetical protein
MSDLKAGASLSCLGCSDMRKKVESLKAERDAFIQYLKEDHPAFADAFDKSGDLIGTHEGFFGYWDDVIKACGGGSYGHSPLELIGGIRIALEKAEAELDEQKELTQAANKELKYLDELLARVEELERITRSKLGGCPEIGHGWDSCQVCGGHPNHTSDCILVLPTTGAVERIRAAESDIINNTVEKLQKLTGEDFHGYRSEVWNVLAEAIRR